MALQSGSVYKIKNLQSGTIISLSCTNNYNVYGWPDTTGDNMTWTLTKNMNETWTIRSVPGDLFLTAPENTNNGYKAIVGNTHFEWTIECENKEDGIYRILVPKSKQSLDMDCGKAETGTKVQLWERWDTGNQKWQFEKIDPASTLSSAFKIINIKGGLAADLHSSDLKTVIGYTSHAEPEHSSRWLLIPIGKDIFHIKNYHHDLYIAVDGDLKNRAPLVAVKKPYEWLIKPNKNNPSVYLIMAASNSVFTWDVPNSTCQKTNTKFMLYERHDGTNQDWKLIPTQIN